MDASFPSQIYLFIDLFIQSIDRSIVTDVVGGYILHLFSIRPGVVVRRKKKKEKKVHYWKREEERVEGIEKMTLVL